MSPQFKNKSGLETDPRRDGGGLGVRGERSKCLLSVHEAPAQRDSPPAGSAWSRRGRGCGWGAGVASCPSYRRTGSLEPAVAPSPFPGCPMRPPRPLPGSPVHRGPAEPASLTCLPPPPHPTLTRPPPKHRAAQAPPDQSLSVPGSWQGPDPSVGTGLRSVTLYPAHAQGPRRVRTARPYLHGPASFPRLARVPRPPHPPGPHPHGASHVGLVRSRPTDTQGPQGRCLRNGQPSAAPWLWTAGLGGRRGTARAA